MQLEWYGQSALGTVDGLFVPVGGGPTIGAAQAVEISQRRGTRWLVRMHHRTERIGFLEPADDFLGRFEHVARVDTPRVVLDELPDERPLVVVPAAP